MDYPNQFLAKVAAEMNKPNGLTVLHPDNLPGSLKHLSLRDLPGVAKGVEARLHRSGVYDVIDLWNLAPKHARAIWGSVEGERFWAQLHGYDVEKPRTERGMYGHGRVLASGWQTPEKAYECARLLLIKAARRMRREGYRASTLSLSLGSRRQGRAWSGQTSFFPTRDDRIFLKALARLHEQSVAVLGSSAKIPKVAVMLSNIEPFGEHTDDLFKARDTATRRKDGEALIDLIDQMNIQHKSAIVGFGLNARVPGGYAGAKIAFGRVPDLQDFD